MITLTEEMFMSGRPVAQGEVLIWMKKYAPRAVLEAIASGKYEEMSLSHDRMIIGHSETGHHHVLAPVLKMPMSEAARAFIDKTNDGIVDLKLLTDCTLTHLRVDHQHGSYMLPKGEYVKGTRWEQSPEGWRRVAD